MKKLRLFDSLKFVLATVACIFAIVPAHADNTWKYAPLSIGYAVNSDLVELTESNESFNTYTVKETTNTPRRMLYVTNANPLPANHKYFMRLRFNSNFTSLPYFRYMLDGTYTNLGYSAGYNTSCRKNEWCNMAQIITPQQKLKLNDVSDGLLPVNNSYTAGETITIDKNGFLTVFDLTEIFGAGNEPATVADAERALSIDTTIKIATTRYNEEQFAPVETRLDAAVAAVDTVVTQTMSQAQQIDQIATNKQTRPDEGCNAKYCLLVEDEDGTPHWYPIAGANGVAHNLPTGYTELQYIESTGTQYIDTGYIPNSNTRWELDNEYTETPPAKHFFNGVYQYQSGQPARFDIALAETGLILNYGATNNVNSNVSSFINTRYMYVVDAKNNKWAYNDTTGSFPSYSNMTTITKPLYLFARNDNSGVDRFAKQRTYSSKIYDDGILVRDFIPAKNSSGVVGMYDMVSGQFFTNAGTGTFVAGPDM